MPRVSTPPRDRAGALLNEGLRAQKAGDWDGALAQYRRAAKIDPTYFGPPMNIGLILKWKSDWRRATAAFARAFELVGDHDARVTVAWNLGIVASAVRDWDLALRAWKALDMPVTVAADGSPALPIGSTPIRIGPRERGGEVVWADRFDPVRARIESIPSPESGYCYGDVLLHDAAPLGKYKDTDLSVFPALARLEKSKHATWTVHVTMRLAEGERLIDSFAAAAKQRGLDVAAEDFTASLEPLVSPGEEGGAFQAAPAQAPADRARHWIAIAARSPGDVHALLETWVSLGAGRAFETPLKGSA